MSTFGGLSPIVAALVMLLLTSYLAIYVGLFASLVARAVRHLGVRGVWLAPVFWVATEYARGVVGGGFPWAPLGASQASVTPIVQLASVTGVWGLSALLALVAAAASAVALSRQRVHLMGAIATLIVVALVGAVGTFRVAGATLTRTGTVLRVGLVQGSIEQAQKWNPVYRDAILRRYLDLSRQAIDAGAGLVFWPESSTPFYFDADSALAAPVRQLAAQARTPFIIGSDIFEAAREGSPERIYNSAVLIGSDGRPRGQYHKMRLVPFGEYVPLRQLLFFVAPLVESVGDFTPGTEPVVFDADGARIGLAICFESVYPSIARQFVARGGSVARDDHERCVVRPHVGAVPALRAGRAPRGGGGALSRAGGQHRHQRRVRPVRPCARTDRVVRAGGDHGRRAPARQPDDLQPYGRRDTVGSNRRIARPAGRGTPADPTKVNFTLRTSNCRLRTQ